jgi:hypothetical protein
MLAARMHCDKHVIKMIVESCQILSTVAREKYKVDIGYKSGWNHHPCVKWAAETDMNFAWLFILARQLCKEYTYRYNKTHKCESLLNEFEPLVKTLQYDDFIEPYLAMPDDCKVPDKVESYRNYYLVHKSHLLYYTRREIPFWIKEAGLGTWKEVKFQRGLFV